MANKSKSKVKSYARRTKKGISRVTGHDRKSDKSKRNRNRNIAIGLGIGTSVLALGLGAKHLAKKKGLKGGVNVSPNTLQAQSVSFTPNRPSPKPKPTVKPETPSATVAEVRQTTEAVVDKAKEIKVNKPKVTVDSKELETLKEINDALNSGEVGKDSIGILRQEKREIADRLRGKSKPKTNKFLDQALTGQGYQPKPKPKTNDVNVDERITRIERQQKWDANRGVILRRKKQLEESLGKKVVDKTKGRLDFNPTPKSRKARKKAAKQVAAEAKRLRDLGEYY